MLTIRLTPTDHGVEQYVGGTIESDAELALWAEATGNVTLGAYGVVATMGNGLRGGGVVVDLGSHVSWWVTV